MNSVTVKVADQITQLGPSIEDDVVGVLVKREREKRATALVKVVDLHAQAEKDLKKVKPDLSYMDEAGKITTMYSKPALDNLNKAKAKVEKHVKAISKALDNKDYNDVYNLANGKEPANDNDNDNDTPEKAEA